MPIFNDSEAIPPFVPEGDYLVRVTELERGISKGAKTSGSDQWVLTLAIEKAATGLLQPGRLRDWLTEHPSTITRMDNFLKCMGVRPPKGSGYSFDADEAAMAGLLYVNPIGLRGWVYLTLEEYQGKKNNKIGVYYTDKQKVQRDEPPPPKELPDWDRPTPTPTPAAAAPADAAADDEDVPF